MGLFLLILSALCEAIWNIYLTKSKGFTDWGVNVGGLLFLVLGIVTFKKALAHLPLSVAIVIWSGLSLMLTIGLDVWIFHTKIDYKTAFFMGLCIVSILGLNYFSQAQ